MTHDWSKSFEIRHRVLRSITRPINDMTIADICRECGISRQTFYKYFPSKFDIAYWYLSIAEELYIYEIGRTISLEDGLNAFFAFLYKEKEFLANAFEPHPDKREIRMRLEKPISEFVFTIQNNFSIVVNDDILFSLTFFMESANCLVASWCLHGLDVEPSIMARRLHGCIPQLLFKLLQDHPVHTMQ